MQYTILHLSDLHYRPDWPEQTELVCQKFFSDVKEQINADQKPLLIFSGDFVQTGSSANAYSAFETRFGPALEAIGITKERRICVPGNHDVSRHALNNYASFQKASLGQIVDERGFNDSLEQLARLFLAENFKFYSAWETNFASYGACKTGLGGAGWAIGDELGVYCLNTALCSFAGLDDEAGKPISDHGLLMVDTRSLYKWLAENSCKLRILVMHHPLDWFAPWARTELEKIIRDNFNLVFSGHVHQNNAVYSTQGRGGNLSITAPPLFKDKADRLGYAIVKVNTDDGSAVVHYREWAPSHKFVLGTAMAANETGIINFKYSKESIGTVEVLPPAQQFANALEILQAEFDEARICYSSKRLVWVERDLANVPETSPEAETAVLTNAVDLASTPH